MRVHQRRWPSYLMLVSSLFLFNGCHSEVEYSYSVSVRTSAAVNPTLAGFRTTLYADYVLDNASITITKHNWEVISGPGGYTLVDDGLEADITPLAVGNYTLRYRAWYYADHDACCSDVQYQESFLVLTVGMAPAG
jgi:hypothetical protein